MEKESFTEINKNCNNSDIVLYCSKFTKLNFNIKNEIFDFIPDEQLVSTFLNLEKV